MTESKPLTWWQRNAGPIFVCVVVAVVTAIDVRVGLALAVALYVTVTVHELGHVVAAWATRIGVISVRIGTGPAVRFRVGSVGVRYGLIPASGLTVGAVLSTAGRWRSLLFLWGGILAELVLLVGTLVFLRGTVVGWTLVAVIAITIVENLIPRQSVIAGATRPTDGQQLLAHREVRKANASLAPVQEALMRADLDRARTLATEGMKRFPARFDYFAVLFAVIAEYNDQIDSALTMLDRVDTVANPALADVVAKNRAWCQLYSEDSTVRALGIDAAREFHEQSPEDEWSTATWALALVALSDGAGALAAIDSLPPGDNAMQRSGIACVRVRALVLLGRFDEAATERDAIDEFPLLRDRAERALAARDR